MKIHKDDVAAVVRVLEKFEGRNIGVVALFALEDAYEVRRARKAAKRERQRKEKDKQVVESVKPAKPFTFWEYSAGDWTKLHVAYDMGKPVVTPSKAPEWDGNASAFDAAMKPKA